MRVDNLDTLTPREQFAYLLGKSFGGERDIYDALGYKKKLEFKHYWNKYQRNGIANRIVKIFPEMTWKDYPTFKSTTRNEEKFKELKNDLRVFSYLERADRMARLGEYGLLIIGFNDLKPNEDLSQPVKKDRINDISDINFLSVISQGSVNNIEIEDDLSSPRYLKPKTYNVALEDKNDNTEVHHSRVVHIVEQPDESDIRGTPCLKKGYNLLFNYEKVTGAPPEANWKQAVQNVLFNVDKEVDLGEDKEEKIKEEVKDLEHSQRRFITAQGMDAQVLESSTDSPRYIYDNIMKSIAGTYGIPKRILTGSERGELASNMDIVTFYSNVKARQTKHAEPQILRPFIDKLQQAGIMSNREYEFEWEKLYDITEIEESEIVNNWAGAISKLTDKYPDIATAAEIRKKIFDFPVRNEEEMVQTVVDELEDRGKKEIAEKLKKEENGFKFMQILDSLNPL